VEILQPFSNLLSFEAEERSNLEQLTWRVRVDMAKTFEEERRKHLNFFFFLFSILFSPQDLYYSWE